MNNLYKIYNKKISFLSHHKLFEANFFDIKNFEFFVKKRNFNFFFYDYKKIFVALKKTIFIIKQATIKKVPILFVGLNKDDSRFYKSFNNCLKTLVLKNGHLYTGHLNKGLAYDYWSFFKRKKNESSTGFFELPKIVIIFSRNTPESLVTELSSSGIPIFYFLGDVKGSNSVFKDYPLFGVYSKKMLSFYLDLLNYSFKDNK